MKSHITLVTKDSEETIRSYFDALVKSGKVLDLNLIHHYPMTTIILSQTEACPIDTASIHEAFPESKVFHSWTNLSSGVSSAQFLGDLNESILWVPESYFKCPHENKAGVHVGVFRGDRCPICNKYIR